ncbi:methyltransferase domain-containing protein [Paraferrimonas sp. SM1919]|uniref:methyltransferase domain-containing protein n=1 Tax=Paraferrimonas sp. SM1919 TaxID=2662263 RepID=UPI0013D7122F|nr:methyltransferase domain-containing protein [Paraferrimonas sp. SM1919]
MSTLKAQVAKSFGNAAKLYHSRAKVQSLSAQALLQGHTLKGQVLDLGCGPGGYLFEALAPQSQCQYFGLDLSLDMLKTHQGERKIQGDAEQLPLQNAAIDAIVSNMAMQWCQLDALAQECYRVLKPKGRLLSAIVCQGSLSELSRIGMSVNTLPSRAKVESAFTQAGFQLSIEMQTLTVEFDSPKALFQSIKGIGASSTQSNCQGLKGKRWWQQSCAALEQQGLTLSYQVALLYAEKLPQ